jgi:hypothetical protein
MEGVYIANMSTPNFHSGVQWVLTRVRFRAKNTKKKQGEVKRDKIGSLTVRRSGLPAFLQVTKTAMPRARQEPVRARIRSVDVARETAPGDAFCLRETIWMPLPESVMLTVYKRCQVIAQSSVIWSRLGVGQSRKFLGVKVAEVTLRGREQELEINYMDERTVSFENTCPTSAPRFTMKELFFCSHTRNVSPRERIASRTTYADKEPLEVGRHF